MPKFFKNLNSVIQTVKTSKKPLPRMHQVNERLHEKKENEKFTKKADLRAQRRNLLMEKDREKHHSCHTKI